MSQRRKCLDITTIGAKNDCHLLKKKRNIKDRLLRLPNTRQTSELRNNYNDNNKQIKRLEEKRHI